MSYFTEEQLRGSLKYLQEETHPFLLSILSMLRVGLPSTDDPAQAIPFGSRDELLVLRDFLTPVTTEVDRPFYMPFGDASTTRWRNAQYPGKSLQRLRSDHPELVRQSPTDKRRWYFVRDYAEVITANPGSYVGIAPVCVGALAVVFFRDRSFDSPDSAIAAFRAEFRLDRSDLKGVFTNKYPDQIGKLSLAATPIPSHKLLEILLEFERQDVGSGNPEDTAQVGPSSSPSLHVARPEEGFGEWEVDAGRPMVLGGLVGVQEAAARASAALASGMHIILTGPPGVGKTKLAESLCRAAGFQYWTLPATDQWSSFEVIGGYFPSAIGGEGLEFVPGHVLESLTQGRCLILDEVNRADIDKAFGELLTLLSGTSVTLPYRRKGADGILRRIQLLPTQQVVADDVEAIVVPDWWRIIGCMNDSDKASLKRLSYAFMRRFAFIPVSPPGPAEFRTLLEARSSTRIAAGASPELEKFADKLASLFTDETNGFLGFGLEFGPAIPLSMIDLAATEFQQNAGRTVEAVLRSSLEAFVAPQLQGRSDVHEEVVERVASHLGEDVSAFGRVLATWTGFVSE